MFVCHLLRCPDGMRHWPGGGWRLLERGWRGSLTQRTEDRGRERGEYTVHSLNTGDQHQLVTCANILNPYLHRFYHTAHGLHRCSCSFIMSYDDMNLSLSEEDIFQIESIK